MMNEPLFIFDIETIPCIETARNLLHLHDESTTDAEVFEQIKQYHLKITNGQNDFLRQPFQKIVCFSFLTCDVEADQNGYERYKLGSLKSGGRNNETERDIVEKIVGFLSKYQYKLVSFNGRTFDLPVLEYRAMKYKIPCSFLYKKNYGYRYSFEHHCDLLEAFSNFGASARVKVAELASLFGIPCKDGIDGSQVYPAYLEGEIDKICNYCESDVLCTFLLYLRYQLHIGATNLANYEQCIEDIISTYGAEVVGGA